MMYDDVVAQGLELLQPFIGHLLELDTIVGESLGPTAWWLGLGCLLLYLKWRV